ncbi:MAG: polyphosphate:AMP phosphotransferase [Myxococcota bacterium]
MSNKATSALFAAAENDTFVSKEEYETRLEKLRVEVLNNQFDLQHADFSVVLLIAGDDRPGCTENVHALREWLDCRFLDTHAIFGDPEESDEEAEHPPFRRYWNRLPADGRIGIFVGGWSTHLVASQVRGEFTPSHFDLALEHIRCFEQQLAHAGTLVLKFWLHLPKKVLKKRLGKAAKRPEKNWEIDERDWEILEVYDEGLKLVEQVVRQTESPEAPWVIVDSRDDRTRNLTVATRINEALSRRLAGPPAETAAPALGPNVELLGETLVLDTIDMAARLDKEVYDKELDRYQAQLNALSRELFRRKIGCVLGFEGWDAAGKGGAIRRLTRAMPIRSARVIPIAAPTEEERAHHYMWRFWRHVPRDGDTVIFDRTWYGRVLVERVEGFASEAEWSRAYAEIADFEQQLCDHGIPLLKFWLHIDPEEQLRRFEARKETPYKKYKLTEEDYRNREKWPDYSRAVHDMVVRTSTDGAPWHVIAANDKRWARIEILRLVCERLERRLDEEPARGKGGGRRKNRDKNGRKKKKDKR